MSDMPAQGDLWMYFRDEDPAAPLHKIHMGFVTKISVSFNKTTSVTPIVTKKAKDAFPLDGGTSKSYTFDGVKIQPSEISDTGSGRYPNNATNAQIIEEQSGWSCRTWSQRVLEFVDRWQMKTDGCWFEYVPSATNPYTYLGVRGKVHGYIRSFEYTYNHDFNEQMTYHMEVVIGTMHLAIGDDDNEMPVENQPNYLNLEKVRYSSSSVVMTSGDLTNMYLLGSLKESSIDSAIESYTITGGPGDPFEHIEMVLSVKKLGVIAPGLVKVANRKGSMYINTNRIIPGLSKIMVNAVGSSTFIVNSCNTKSNNTKISVKGYCEATKFKNASFQYTADASTSLVDTPYNVIRRILLKGASGPKFDGGHLIELVKPQYKDPSQPKITFSGDENNKYPNCWYMLQVCATLIGCKIFFANDNAYLIDYTLDFSSETDRDITSYGTIEAYPMRRTVNPQSYMYGRTLSTSYGSQGKDAVTEKVIINCINSNGEEDAYEGVDEIISNYKETVDGSFSPRTLTLDIPELVKEGSEASPEQFASNYLEYMREPQQSITIKVKETMTDVENGARYQAWRATFATVSQADEILDRSKDMPPVSNYSDYISEDVVEDGETVRKPKRIPQKLYLSSYRRSYPECTSEYEWGVINEVDLSNRLAEGFQS